jgi:hypothetical protein
MSNRTKQTILSDVLRAALQIKAKPLNNKPAIRRKKNRKA